MQSKKNLRGEAFEDLWIGKVEGEAADDEGGKKNFYCDLRNQNKSSEGA